MYANVKVVITGMVLSAFYVLTDKYGIQWVETVYAQLIIDGMVLYVRNLENVLQEEYTINNMINVSVQILIFGMVLHVYNHHNAVVVKLLTKKLLNVTALVVFISMGTNVSHVLMESIGNHLKENVYVLILLNGMEDSV